MMLRVTARAGHGARVRPSAAGLAVVAAFLLGPGGSGLASAWVGIPQGGVLAAQALDPSPELRLERIVTLPATPSLGMPFEIEVTLRAPDRFAVTLADTLRAAEFVEGHGTGSWEAERVPGEGVLVTARYPAIAFREGLVLLPSLEIEVATEGGAGAAEGRHTLRLGAVRIDDVPAPDGLGALEPRPPADVLGGDRSRWGILAATAWVLAGVVALGGGVAVRRTRSPRRSEATTDPRDRALRDLDALLARGPIRGEAVVPFYDGLMAVVRTALEGMGPALGPDRTGRELLATLTASRTPGPHPEALHALAEALARADAVRFGRLRPGPEVAEADAARVRGWLVAYRSGRLEGVA